LARQLVQPGGGTVWQVEPGGYIMIRARFAPKKTGNFKHSLNVDTDAGVVSAIISGKGVKP